MEQAYNITKCDCCGIEKRGTFASLENDGWVKYSYKSTWKTGIHSGEIDHHKTICSKCDRGEGFRYFYLSMKNRIKEMVNSVIRRTK